MAASLALQPLNCPHLSVRERRPISASKRTPKKTTPLSSPPSLTPNPNLPPKKVLVPIAFGTEEMEAVILADVLRRAGADVLLASVEQGLEVEGSSGTKIEADAYVSDCADEVFDLVALPLMTSAGAHRKQEFNQVNWSFDRTPHILVPVANGCEETEVVVLVDILRRAKADVVVASVEKSTTVVASQQTRIIVDKFIEEASDSTYDLVVLPGGVTGSERLHKSKVLKRLLKEQKAGGRMYGGICSSAAILQKQGLIMEKVTVSHPEVVSKPTGQLFIEADIVIDGKLITGRGLGTVLEFSLAIVHKLFGHGRAISVAEGIVFEYGKS